MEVSPIDAMKCADEFRSRDIAQLLLTELGHAVKSLARPIRIMEVCGTHTMSIFRHGIRSMLPAEITLLSGPGCPVCVTPTSHIDRFIQAAQLPDTIITVFGDLIRVPGSDGSLASARAEGAQVEIVYSPMDALTLAQNTPDKKIIFPAVGFETTAPTIAATIVQADKLGLDNFFILAAGKTMPGPLIQLMADPALNVDALLCPGHVSAIIGADAYLPLAKDFNLHCAVAGFEPADILAGILSLVKQCSAERAEVSNCYTRAVSAQGNIRAQELIAQVFEAADSDWRGLGMIPQSGLELRESYQHFDAIQFLTLPETPATAPKGCRCGDVLKGQILPPDCPLYGKRCTPTLPVGPCMVSHEGTCAAYYQYSL